MQGKLILETGEIFIGTIFGSLKDISAEVVFNTSMVGYPEAMTDPSYRKQILILTYPCIGNYGIPSYARDKNGILKYFESEKIHISGLIISDYCKNDSHWMSCKSLSDWMKECNIPGIYGIDTRELTKIIREKGTMFGKIVCNNDVPLIKEIKYNLVEEVSRSTETIYNKGNKYKIIAIDCGMKNNIIRKFLEYEDIELKVVPYNYKININECDGLFISNGPGDPELCRETIDTIKNVINNEKVVPVFGICLGNQLLGLASGCKTIKLKYGNRGVNQPVINLRTMQCHITSQNHGYAIDNNSISDDWSPYFINGNDHSNEGIIHNTLPYFGVQFHPEAKNGPRDTEYLFDLFISKVRKDNYYNINRNYGFYHRIKNREISKVLLLGSGGLSIGQAGEFDYSGSQAIKALKEEGIEVILINPNIATVQTSKNLADKIYYVPVNSDSVKNIIERECPDSIMINFGGQTALNCAIELYNEGYFEKNNVRVLGTEIDSVIVSEDREKFAQLMDSIGEPVSKRYTVKSLEDLESAINNLGFPMIMRNGFALGGLGSCFIYNKEELEKKTNEQLRKCPEILLEKSIKGWKEVEYEIVRDYCDNCIAVCNMENFDPVGVHTGDSIVIAPSQTLSDSDYYRLRSSAIKIAKKLKIVGECNVQFALDPNSDDYIIIELNPRLSRSSALASKATGYPLAYIAAKILLGKDLIELKNSVTKKTISCHEPSLDYLVVKIPKWEFLKFKHVHKLLDSSMKSVGEVMAIGRNFEETIQKAIRMVDESNIGFFYKGDLSRNELEEQLKNPSYNRILYISKAFDMDYSVDEIFRLTKIDRWFLYKLHNIHKMKKLIIESNITFFNNDQYLRSIKDVIISAKKVGFSDKFLSKLIKCPVNTIKDYRYKYSILPVVKQIDTTGGEFPAETNYLYVTYNGEFSDVTFDKEGTIVLGCGSYKIGSSVEFDWCAVNCINTLRKSKKYTIIINYNPETVSTDYDMSDRLYFEEISLETVTDIYNIEKANGIILSVGGQTPNNLALNLHCNNLNILGTHPKNIDNAEDRHKFSKLLDEIGVDQPEWKEMSSLEDATDFCNKVDYPVLIRPSYVLSGAAMKVAENEEELKEYLHMATTVSNESPVVISKFILNAKEIEVDAVADKGNLINYAISEHLENAGVHSGDATIILPAQKLYLETIKRIKKVTKKIANRLNISGPFNIQFISKENEIKVIECNLRASRSFPFVSKTLDTNFIETATYIMIGKKYSVPHIKIEDIEYVAIKVPVFSFSRLPNVDPILGVEMASTGEIACFGNNVRETYLKALISGGFKIPKKNILLSIGHDTIKYDFINSLICLKKMGYRIYATDGTHIFYNNKEIYIDKISMEDMMKNIENNNIELLINIPKNLYSSNNNTNGFIMRRKCLDYSIPVITNIKCAKLFVSSLKEYKKNGIDYTSWNDYINL